MDSQKPAELGDDRPAEISVEIDASRWYVVQTQPRAETRAIVNLENQEFRTFCPFVAKTVRHARKVTKTRAPLFPGYLFVSLDPSRNRWRAVNGTRGVVRLLTQNDMPAAVPSGVVEALLARTGEGSTIDWSLSLAVGQTVRICDGPFAELVGCLEHLDKAGRVRVLLDLMGRAVSVMTHADRVRPAN